MKFYLVFEDHCMDDMSAALIGIFLNEGTAKKCMEIRMEENKDAIYWGEEHYLDVITPEIYKDPDMYHKGYKIPRECEGKILTQQELSKFEWSRSNGKRPKSLTEQLIDRGIKKENFEIKYKQSGWGYLYEEEWVVGIELTNNGFCDCYDIWIFNLKDDSKTELHSGSWDLQYEKDAMEEVLEVIIDNFKDLEREQLRKRFHSRQED
ncbi:hypothetical protein ACHHV8_11120 [Paenibacillus sp. TAB 01]|uniref:hypothetical protein n=1 Tax=Paenibacillus sp. TAB 01 TaxID=3368988 RepID=UPI00375187BF